MKMNNYIIDNINHNLNAGVAELVDALDSKSSADFQRVGSSPTFGTKTKWEILFIEPC